MREWLNGYDFVGASRLNPKAEDVMASRKSNPAESVFEIPQGNGQKPLTVTGFSSFVTTHASAYCFLPSITALKFIAVEMTFASDFTKAAKIACQDQKTKKFSDHDPKGTQTKRLTRKKYIRAKWHFSYAPFATIEIDRK